MANETIARATIVLYDGAEQPVAEELQHFRFWSLQKPFS